MFDSISNVEGSGRRPIRGFGSDLDQREGAPEWLISFADNVALMMGFFVLLLAMNMAKATVGGGGETGEHGEVPREERMLDFAIAVREAFNNPVDINSTDPRDKELVQRLMQRAGRSETRDPGVKGYEQDVQALRPSQYYGVGGTVTFQEGVFEMPASGREIIKDIARKVKGLRLVIEVRGHASSVESMRGAEQSMRLSADRAMAVARALAEEGVDWWQMRLEVCGDHERLQAYPSNRHADKANARVEVVITDQVVPDPVPTRYGEPSDADSRFDESQPLE